MAARRNWVSTWLLLATVIYYLVPGTAAHTEIRYVVSMHTVLPIFAGVTIVSLVGAIANEASVNSSQIGAIEVTDRFSLVDVPEELSRRIIEALSRTRIKGQKVTVRLFRE